jgi:beta-galactosidase/beta-glucuronidase
MSRLIPVSAKLRCFLLFVVGLPVSLAACPVRSVVGQEIVDQWRYTLRRPADRWREAEFDDSAWKEAPGGFGTHGTPGARIGTNWSTGSIWLRKEFSLESVPARPALLMHHDEDVEVYLNGRPVAARKGFTTEYIVVPLGEEKREALHEGKNVMAVHCRQTRGGQFIDVHLVDADNVPKLPPATRNTRPFQSELITKWGEEVTPENAWTEYPRPQMQRDNWTNLNGLWDYTITPAKQTDIPKQWNGKILAPFCLESKLGGVQRLLDPTEALWYRRTFEGAPRANQRTILNFEAVDYRCAVFVNGKSIPVQGSDEKSEQGVHFHQGGNTPFWLDVTEALRDGENELVVRVEDDTEGWQLRGKQTLNPRGIWYTQVSGIWQTVWLEQVAGSYFTDLKITTDAEAGTITVRPTAVGRHRDGVVEVVVFDGDREVAREKGKGPVFTLTVEDAALWSPESPHLYDLHVTLFDEDGDPLDRVKSYAGIRSVGKVRGEDGHWRFTLNGEPIFHWGPLDQGWWPDGLLTPPADEAMRRDIEWLKSAGFNMIRKHIKVEPRRYYYHCDRLGMMVWQDHVSGGEQPAWTRLRPNPVDAQWPPKQHKQFMLELARMIDTLENHPSIVCWVPFNERWGQHRTMEVGRWTAKRDPTRLVNIASGGNFWPVGDVVDAHKYPHPGFPFQQGEGGRFDDYIKVMGEFGGHGYPIKGHLWDADRRNWGYGGLPQNQQEYKERYVTSLRMLNELRAKGIAAGVYTQTTDVEGEINGLMTYDRKVVKIPAKELAGLHEILFDQPPRTAGRETNPRFQSKRPTASPVQ